MAGLLALVLGCSADGGGAREKLLVRVPAGAFMMGCAQADGGNCSADEYPAHSVELPEFEIQQFEVTQMDYEGCMAAGACTRPAANFRPAETPELPVRDVTWDQATAYCQWLGLRLPTEAEWEKTARGTDTRSYPWGETEPSCKLANFAGCGGIAATGALPSGASPFGAMDMAGNVFEWVSDHYAADYYRDSPGANPQGPASGEMRVARGGSFNSGSYTLTTTHRIEADPAVPYDSIGIRCARSLP